MTDYKKRFEETLFLLTEAVDSISCWADYADEYFKQKHDLKGELKYWDDTVKRLTIIDPE